MSSISSSPSALTKDDVVSRKRNALACIECNRRKKKCVQGQGSHACYYCSSKSIQCRFPSRLVKRARKKIKADLDSLTSEDYSFADDNVYQTKSIINSGLEASSSGTLGSSSETIVHQISSHSPTTSPFCAYASDYPNPQESSITIDVQDWTHSTFLAQNSRDDWINAYYSDMYRSLPFLSMPWLTEGALDIPLGLLHVMYACTVVSKSPKVATAHYKQALKMIYEDFQKADPLTIVTFLHFHYFEGDSDIASVHFSNAVKFTVLLELDKPCSYSWVSPNGNLMGY